MKLEEISLVEASYKGNIGMLEMFKFYQVATAAQKTEMKSLINAKKYDEAWKLLQSVTNVRLHDLVPVQETL